MEVYNGRARDFRSMIEPGKVEERVAERLPDIDIEARKAQPPGPPSGPAQVSPLRIPDVAQVVREELHKEADANRLEDYAKNFFFALVGFGLSKADEWFRKRRSSRRSV